MKHVYKEPEKNDANALHSSVVAANCDPCKNFDDDWRNFGSKGNVSDNIIWNWDAQHRKIIPSG